MNIGINKLQRNTLALAISITLTSGYGQAQATEGKESGIERIQVTSQKRVQSVQEVGIAISALDADDLKNRGIDDVAGIAQAISNVELQDITGGGMPVMIVRGVGLQDIRVNNTPTTPFYIDEVYQASIAQSAFTMFDIERVELLKGPQGGLYGRNATGGAVQVISEKPELVAANGYVNATYGKWNRMELEGAFGSELSDTVAFRVAGKRVTSDDTYSHSVSENKDHGEADAWGGRAMLRINPNDDFDVLLKVHAGEDRSETDLLRASAAFAGNTASGQPGVSYDALLVNTCETPGAASCYTMDGRTHAEQGVNGRVHESTSSTLPSLDNKWSGFSTRIDLTLGDYALTSITAYDEMDHRRNTDFDGHAYEAQHIFYRSDLESRSQELRLAHSADSYSWILGASYAKDTLVEDTDLFGSQGPLTFVGLTRAAQPYEQKTTSKSVYGHLDYSVTDMLMVTAELRYTDETKSMSGGTTLPEMGGFMIAGIDESKGFDAISGKLGASYQLNNDAMVYGSLSRGFKSGGFPGGLTTDASTLAPYEQEIVHAVELGTKTEWLDNSLRINGAIFHYDYQDQQGLAQVINPLTGSIVKKLTNLGDTEVDGAELDVTWLPAEGWYVQLGLGFTDATIADSEFTTKDTFLSASHPNSDVALEGARLPNVADWSLNTAVSYEHSLSEALLGVVQITYAIKDDTDLTMAISDREKAFYNEDGYGLLNLRYTIMNEDKTWSANAFINNASDKKYRSVARPDGLNGFYEMYGAPRSFGISFTYNWE